MSRARDIADGNFANDLTVDTNTLKVDSANNRVGIGTAPDRDLHVKGATGDPVHLKLEGDPADYARIMFDDGTDDNIGEIRYHFGDENMRFTVNAAERLRIHASGSVTMPNQPVYSASDSRALSGSNSHLNSSNFYNHEYVNVGNHMNTSNGNFTCPVAGVYRIYFRATHENQGCNVRLQKNGSTINEAFSGAPGSDYSVSSEAVVSCAANDTLRIQFASIDMKSGNQHKQVTFQLLH